jgi:hypothetical protein
MTDDQDFPHDPDLDAHVAYYEAEIDHSSTADLADLTDLLATTIGRLEHDQLPTDRDELIARFVALGDCYARLRTVVEWTEQALIARIDHGEQVEIGGTMMQVRRQRSRTRWDTDDLRRAVLDTKLVDPTSGEVADESPLDKVLAVWNLGSPRVTALRQRGIDPDEFCTTEDGPLRLVPAR